MPEFLVFFYAKIIFLVSLPFVAVKDRSVLTFYMYLHKYVRSLHNHIISYNINQSALSFQAPKSLHAHTLLCALVNMVKQLSSCIAKYIQKHQNLFV